MCVPSLSFFSCCELNNNNNKKVKSDFAVTSFFSAHQQSPGLHVHADTPVWMCCAHTVIAACLYVDKCHLFSLSTNTCLVSTN